MAAAVCTPSRRHLARAGWGVVSGSSLPGLPTPPRTPEQKDDQTEGKRLVGEVASCWSSRYIFHIRYGGRKDGLYHYEVLFSLPTKEKPVPSIVVAVFFAFLPEKTGQDPRLFYQFEEGDLRHEWRLEKDRGRAHRPEWHASKGQPVLSLRYNSFERYLDFYTREKETYRRRGINLITKYEEPRLVPPPVGHGDDEDDDAGSMDSLRREESLASTVAKPDPATAEFALAMQDALKAANMYCDKVAPPSSLPELLANILDAADEDNTGTMSHYEVSRLLMATLPGFGLEEWDIHHLLTYATEDQNGFIDSRSLVEQAQDVVFALRQRRLIFNKHHQPDCTVPNESIKHCYSEELERTVEDLKKLLEACAAENPSRALYFGVMVGNSQRRPSRGSMGSMPMDQEPSITGNETEDKELVALQRRYLRECLQALHERISPQEASMLMQMLPEDENGFVMVDDLTDRWETLRTEALLNAVVGANTKALRMHLVTRLREVGIDEYGRMKVWKLREVLLSLDQICLSRLQMHVLMCLADPNANGDVDVGAFAGLCSSVVPHMLSAELFVEIAERLMQEHAEAAKERANAELAALGAAKDVKAADDDEDAHVEKKVEVDQETVERTLIQVFSLCDDTRKQTPVLPPETIFKTLWNPSDAQVQGLNLDELEVAGLVGEMQLDANGEVPYHDFVKRWVPILFELRRNPHLGGYLKEGAAEHLGFPEPDLKALEDLYPLLPEGHKERILQAKAALNASLEQQQAAQAPVVSRRPSKEAARRASKERVPRRTSTLQGRDSVATEADSEVMAAAAKAGLVEKEPPPGRGYLRRKAALADARRRELEAAAAPAAAPAAEVATT